MLAATVSPDRLADDAGAVGSLGFDGRRRAQDRRHQNWLLVRDQRS
jgi:hypothetical protein